MSLHIGDVGETTAAGLFSTGNIVLALSVLVQGGGARESKTAYAAENRLLAGHRLGRVRRILMIVPPVHIREGEAAEDALVGMVLTNVRGELNLSKAVAALGTHEAFLF